MKKILLISYYFPPYNHPGVQRALKFAKYLPLFGYHPVVFTCGNMPWRWYDYETYNSEVKDRIEVHKADAPRFGSPKRLLFPSRWINKFILQLEALLFEDRLDWAFGARKEAVNLVKDKNIDLAFTSGPPQSVHFLGYHIKKKAGIPWVADFRDPFVKYTPALESRKLKDRTLELKKKTLFTAYERMWMRRVSFVTAVTEPITEYFKSVYPEAASRITSITNGFDEQDFAGLIPNKAVETKFTIVYTGRFWRSVNPIDFLQGLNIALKHNPSLRNQLKIIFVGEYNKKHMELMNSPEFHGIIETPGGMDHRDAISYQMGSDANLLIISAPEEKGGKYIFTGKIFEYLRAGRPILAIVPKGIVWNFVEKNRLGYTVLPQNHEGIARAILALYKKWKNNSLESFKAPKALLEQYERQNLTRRLSEIFDMCLSHNKNEQ
jgi:glycosyltransferase involved in cell wall biosynthesis